MVGEVLPVEMAGAFARAPLAERQQPAELRIPGPVGRIDQHGQAVAQIEPAADDQPDAGFLGAVMRAREAGQRVAVGDRDCRQAQQPRLREQFLDMRRAAQERVVRGDLEFGVTGHGVFGGVSGPPWLLALGAAASGAFMS